MKNTVHQFQDLPPGVRLARAAVCPSGHYFRSPFSSILRDNNTRVRVFASSDGRYILKTLMSPAETAAVYAGWGYPISGHPWASHPGDDIATATTELRRCLASASRACALIPQQSGLLHVHGAPSPIPCPAMIDGADHDLSAVPFLLQRRAVVLEDVLHAFREANDLPAAKHALDQVLQFVMRLWRQGISDDTLRFHDSYGFRAGRVQLLDVGELLFTRKEAAAQIDGQRRRILSDPNHPAVHWLTLFYPELLPHLLARATRWFVPEYVQLERYAQTAKAISPVASTPSIASPHLSQISSTR